MRNNIKLFGGDTYVEEFDKDRLSRQLFKVKKLMLDGRWRILRDISEITSSPQASVSARLRDLRKKKFGGHIVERRRKDSPEKGLFEYRVIINTIDNQELHNRDVT